MSNSVFANRVSPLLGRLLLFVTGALLLAPRTVEACAVCFGDPDSDLAKGAVRGVAFMIMVTAVMLLSIASIAGVWIVRARRLENGATQPDDQFDFPTEG